MRTLYFLNAKLVLIACCLLLPGCPGQKSNLHGNQSPDAGHTQDDSNGTDTASTGPAEPVLNILVSLGYKIEALHAAYEDLIDEGHRNSWNVSIEFGQNPLAFGSVSENGDQVYFIKFVEPSNELSPDTIKPGDDLTARVSEALGLTDEDYRPAPWVTSETRKEFRKYEQLGDNTVCTRRVLIFIDPQNNGLSALHFKGDDLDPSHQIVIDAETAKGTAEKELDDLTRDVIHTELVQLTDESGRGADPVIFWEVVFVNGLILYVNCINGEVTRLDPGK